MAKITRVEQAVPTIKTKKKVAAYARISMESERMNHSLSAQISYYSSLIQKKPDWQYAGVFADDGISGTGIAKRDEFKRMIEAADNGEIDIILTKSIQRFARNTVDLLETVRHLKDIGVEVEGVKTARAVFDGYTDKKDADFIEERRVRTAETRQDTRSAILNVLSESRLGSMPSNELRAAVLREIGCSDSTYNRVYSDLTKSSQIAKQAIRGKDGRNRWYTCYCGETSDKVPF